MDSLLSLKENMFLKIENKHYNSLYKCFGIENIKLEGYKYSSRYYLQSEKNQKKIILEVKKDKRHNIIISSYHTIEKVDFNTALLSTLGSETIFYKSKNMRSHRPVTQYKCIIFYKLRKN